MRTGVDDPGIVPPPADEIPVAHFVFPGSFLYPPHQDAAEWFALYVLPPLRKLLPACRIVFAGECPDWMPAFGELHGIEVTGALDDLGAVLDARSVVIAPIRAGSGTIVEVIEAWARGVPVVATSRAIEGLEASDGVDVLVADDPAEFAARCSMAARYPELRAKLAGNGRARYEAEFTWPVIGAGLVAWLRTLLPARQAEARGVVDQAHVAEPHGDGDRGDGRGDRGRCSGTQRERVEHLDVLEAGQRLGGDDGRGGRAMRRATEPPAGDGARPPRRARAARTPRPPRCAASRRTLRLDIASPSGSRTIGAPTISMPRSRSHVIRRITASCWKSFSPNTATSGRTAPNSLVTTVVTPRKWPGRAAPSITSASAPGSTWVSKPVRVHRARRRRVDGVDARRRRQRSTSSSIGRG